MTGDKGLARQSTTKMLTMCDLAKAKARQKNTHRVLVFDAISVLLSQMIRELQDGTGTEFHPHYPLL